jgi:hypothetical protein
MRHYNSWTPPLGYKGYRTSYRQACRVKLIRDPAASAALVSHNVVDMYEWCEENCNHPWSHVDGCWWFDKTNEAVMFKMVFGGR